MLWQLEMPQNWVHESTITPARPVRSNLTLCYCILFTARKRSLGQGNIFWKRVSRILSTGEWCLLRGGGSGPGGFWSWGSLVPGGACSGGSGPEGVWSMGVPARGEGLNPGGSGQEGLVQGVWSGGVSRLTPKGEVEGDQVQAHTQREIEGEHVQAHTQGGIEGDLVQAHTQGGS